MHQHNVPQHRARRTNGYFWGFLAIAGYFLFTEHRAHIVPYLPFLLLLACPLMHFFMHRGHEHGHGRHEQAGSGGRGDCCGHPHTQVRDSQAPGHEGQSPDRPA